MNYTKNVQRVVRWILILSIVALIYAGVLLIVNMARYGGDLVGWTRVKDFSLCQAGDTVVGTPTAVVLAPRSAIAVCGYLEMDIKNPAARPVRLAFYLYRDSTLIHAQDTVRDTPGKFSVSLRTRELLVPGNYKVEVIDAFRRNWKEVVTFEIK